MEVCPRAQPFNHYFFDKANQSCRHTSFILWLTYVAYDSSSKRRCRASAILFCFCFCLSIIACICTYTSFPFTRLTTVQKIQLLRFDLGIPLTQITRKKKCKEVESLLPLSTCVNWLQTLFIISFYYGLVFKGSSFPPKREYLVAIEMYFSINFQLTVCRFVAQKAYIFSLQLYVYSVYQYRGSDIILYVQKYIRDIGLILPRSLNIRRSCYFIAWSWAKIVNIEQFFQFVTYSSDFY